MIVMNEQVISSSQEVSYENLDILDCAVVTADLDLEEDPEDHPGTQSFTSLMADLRKDKNKVSSFSRCSNEHFLQGIASVKMLAH